MSPQPESGLFRVKEADGVTVVEVAAEDLDAAAAQAVGEWLFALADGLACPHLRLDMKQVLFLSSTAPGKLIALDRRVRAAGGRLALFDVQEMAYEVFNVTRLVWFLDVHWAARDLPALSPTAS